jgi:hypothetical protein
MDIVLSHRRVSSGKYGDEASAYTIDPARVVSWTVEEWARRGRPVDPRAAEGVREWFGSEPQIADANSVVHPPVVEQQPDGWSNDTHTGSSKRHGNTMEWA